MDQEFNPNSLPKDGPGYVYVPQISVVAVVALLFLFWPGAIIYVLVVHGNIKRALAHNEAIDAARRAAKGSERSTGGH